MPGRARVILSTQLSPPCIQPIRWPDARVTCLRESLMSPEKRMLASLDPDLAQGANRLLVSLTPAIQEGQPLQQGVASRAPNGLRPFVDRQPVGAVISRLKHPEPEELA